MKWPCKQSFFSLSNLFRFIKNCIRDEDEIQGFRIVGEPLKKNQEVYFKIQGMGGAFNIKLKATEIVENPDLLNRFNHEDKSFIIIESNLCSYKVTGINYEANKSIIITLEANFSSKVYVKKYHSYEIILNSNLFKKLSRQEQELLLKLEEKEKVTPININKVG